MPIEILMPALSPTMEEGNLAKWVKKEGDSVAAGDVIAEIETDKATMEVEAVDEGVLGRILVAEGTEGVGVSGFATSGLDTITGKAFSTSVGERVYSVRIDGDVIPTPGAAALFGLAGLTASRRRR